MFLAVFELKGDTLNNHKWRCNGVPHVIHYPSNNRRRMMDELRRKYEIALEALWHYGKPSNWHMCGGGDERHRHYGFGADEPERLEGFEVARKALNEIWKIEENTKPKIVVRDRSQQAARSV